MITKHGQVHLRLPLAEAYRRSAEALNVIGANLTSENPSARRIEAHVSMSLTSWGEKLLVEVSGIDNDALVSVTSKSRMPTTLFDFGKNARNVERILSWLGAPPS